MEWGLDVGPHIKSLQRVEAQTGKVPAMLEEQPELFELLGDVWEAFATLDKSRQYGWSGPQPILFSEIEAYCRLNDPPDCALLVYYIQLLDAKYLEKIAEKNSSGKN